jgi:hypothetical protein
LTSNESGNVDTQDVVPKRRKRGAPPGNRNRFKTGQYSNRNHALRRDIAELKRTTRWIVCLAEAALQARARKGDMSGE